jgi:hypothetical protein
MPAVGFHERTLVLDSLGRTAPQAAPQTHVQNDKVHFRMSYRIAIDTGGTFTDVVVADPNHNLTVKGAD